MSGVVTRDAAVGAPGAGSPGLSGPPAVTRWDARDTWFVVGAVAAALVLRAYQLGTDALWVDEIRAVLRPDGLAFFESVRRSFGPLDPPLSFLVTSVSSRLPFLGLDAAARVPSAIAGAAEVGLAYVVLRRIAGRRLEAIVVAVLLAVAPFAIRWGQEARYYALFSALHLLLWWMFLRVVDRRRFALTGWAVAAVLAVYTNVLAWLVLGVQVLAFVVVARRRTPEQRPDLVRALVALGAVVASFVPWAVYEAAYWIPAHRRGVPIEFNQRRPDVRVDPALFVDTARWLLGNASGALAAAAVAVALVAFTGRRRRAASLMAGYAIVVVVAMVPLSQAMATYLAFRRIAFLVPVLLAIVALGVGALADHVARLSRRPGVGLAVAALCTAVLVALSARATLHQYGTEKSAYRALAHVVAAAPEADLVVMGSFHDTGNAPWPPSIRAYLRAQGVDRRVYSLDDLAAAPPSGDVAWITGAPAPDARFRTEALNDVDRLQYLVGDRSLHAFSLPVYVLWSHYDTPEELAAQAATVRALGSTAPAP